MSPRVRRIRQAFVASTTLRPMAQQLIQDRTPAAYAGVEAYARAHPKEDAGALAWIAVGYAHVIDRECAKAIDPFNRAKPLAGDLGDYVAYYLGMCYLQTGRQAEGMATLANFSTTFPDSLLARDAHLAYASGLLTEGRAAEAALSPGVRAGVGVALLGVVLAAGLRRRPAAGRAGALCVRVRHAAGLVAPRHVYIWVWSVPGYLQHQFVSLVQAGLVLPAILDDRGRVRREGIHPLEQGWT